MRSLGIDASTWTGLVLLDDSDQTHKAAVVNFPMLKGIDRVQSIAQAVGSFIDQYPLPDVVMIEAYALGNRWTKLELIEVGTGIRLELAKRKIKWETVSPTTLKKWTTGKGNAKKPDMAKACTERWGFVSKSDDIVDAYALARYGLHLKGLS